ncbi:MAG TPA: hypothetical protein VG456_23220 [Candidatus Sulfopaludibacter sp.]|jgi:hypothetical protein|nr:hypothetical protein [Candidatus Sulfopaludibacter sp.]
MSDPELPRAIEDRDAGKATRGINLWVVYGLMLLALLVAIGLAILIVLPFYHRR